MLDTASDDKDLARFVNKKWIETYSVNKEIRTKTPMLRTYLCDFSDAYIVVKGDITLEGDNDANKQNKSCI